MADDRGTRIEALCLAALERGEGERAAFLEQACGGDADLRHEVESLLAGRSQVSGFLEDPAWSPAAPLAPGTRLGAYEILSLVGEGGMGQVYRAWDARLDRTVALKVLPPALAADPDRRTRFEREAKAIAGLNHPHICTLHDVGRERAVGGDPPAPGEGVPLDFLVMEHLAGESLAARLERAPLPLTDALTTAREIAQALAAAHRQGVVHRDLKPGNVMMTAEGAKLLDFGLAKLRAHGERPAVAMAAASSTHLTVEGTIVGTLHYMAPEQIEGRPADARSDIWAFGVVLYEMIAGRRAFDGPSAASLVAGILQGQPAPLSDIQPPVPPALEALIRKCLAKSPDDRWQTAGDLVRELDGVAERTRRGTDSGSPGAVAAGATKPHRRNRHLWIPAAVIAVSTLAGGIALWKTGILVPVAPPRLSVLTSMPGTEGFPALSPDGRQVAFIWTGGKTAMAPRLYLKVVGESEAKPLTTAPGFEFCPAWSPDGSRIAFLRRPDPPGAQSTPGIYSVSALGGDEQRLRNVPGIVMMGGLSWSPDKRWLAFAVQPRDASQSGIYMLPVSGGDPVRITSPKPGENDLKPAFSWNGRFLAFSRIGGQTLAKIIIVPLSPDGLPSGNPRQVATPASWALTSSMAWSRDDKSLIASGNDSLSYLYRVRVDGRQPIERLDVAGPNAILPTVSASGNRLAFTHGLGSPDIWRFPVNGTPEPIISSTYYDGEPQFSRDGQRLVFVSYRTGEAEIYTADADGANPRQLTRGLPGIKGSPAWSPDGTHVAFDRVAPGGQGDIYVVDADGGQLRPLTTAPTTEALPSWSRDGRWIYFSSDRDGGNRNIWRVAAAGGEWARMTTAGGAWYSCESVDGRTLFYTHRTRVGSRDMDALVAKPLDGQPERQINDEVADHGVAVVDDGVYYLVSSVQKGTTILFFYDAKLGTSTEVMRYGTSAGGGLAVSPDRKTFLWSVSSQMGTDLMLLDNFR